jgi:hypothetical protein
MEAMPDVTLRKYLLAPNLSGELAHPRRERSPQRLSEVLNVEEDITIVPKLASDDSREFLISQ